MLVRCQFCKFSLDQIIINLQELVTRARNAFDIMDTDGNGRLTVEEFGAVLTAVGTPLTEDEVEQTMEAIFGTDEVDFSAYLVYYIKRKSNPQAKRDSFALLDVDHSGAITQDEMSRMFDGLDRLGLHLTDKEKRIAFYAADTDDNQRLDFEEYLKIQQGKK